MSANHTHTWKVANGAPSTTISLASTGVVNGRLLLASVEVQWALDGGTCTPPAGWNTLFSGNDSEIARTYVFWKVSDSEPGSWVFNTSNDYGSAIIVEFAATSGFPYDPVIGNPIVSSGDSASVAITSIDDITISSDANNQTFVWFGSDSPIEPPDLPYWTTTGAPIIPGDSVVIGVAPSTYSFWGFGDQAVAGAIDASFNDGDTNTYNAPGTGQTKVFSGLFIRDAEATSSTSAALLGSL